MHQTCGSLHFYICTLMCGMCQNWAFCIRCENVLKTRLSTHSWWAIFCLKKAGKKNQCTSATATISVVSSAVKSHHDFIVIEMISCSLYSLRVIAYITATTVSFLVKCACNDEYFIHECSAASALCRFLSFVPLVLIAYVFLFSCCQNTAEAFVASMPIHLLTKFLLRMFP